MDRRRFVKSVGCAGTLAAATQLPAGASCMDEMMRLSQNRPSAHGMGYVVLDKDKSFAEQVTQENTIYEIRYDFELGGKMVPIPQGCVLKFEGGCLGNGSLNSNNTFIEASDDACIFIDVNLFGLFLNDYVSVCWFGAKNSYYKNISEKKVELGRNDCCPAIKSALLTSFKKIYFPKGAWYVSNTITLNKEVEFLLSGKSDATPLNYKASSIGFDLNEACIFTDKDISLITTSENLDSSLRLVISGGSFDVSLIESYTNAVIHLKSNCNLWGIDINTAVLGKLNSINEGIGLYFDATVSTGYLSYIRTNCIVKYFGTGIKVKGTETQSPSWITDFVDRSEIAACRQSLYIEYCEEAFIEGHYQQTYLFEEENNDVAGVYLKTRFATINCTVWDCNLRGGSDIPPLYANKWTNRYAFELDSVFWADFDNYTFLGNSMRYVNDGLVNDHTNMLSDLSKYQAFNRSQYTRGYSDTDNWFVKRPEFTATYESNCEVVGFDNLFLPCASNSATIKTSGISDPYIKITLDINKPDVSVLLMGVVLDIVNTGTFTKAEFIRTTYTTDANTGIEEYRQEVDIVPATVSHYKVVYLNGFETLWKHTSKIEIRLFGYIGTGNVTLLNVFGKIRGKESSFLTCAGGAVYGDLDLRDGARILVDGKEQQEEEGDAAVLIEKNRTLYLGENLISGITGSGEGWTVSNGTYSHSTGQTAPLEFNAPTQEGKAYVAILKTGTASFVQNDVNVSIGNGKLCDVYQGTTGPYYVGMISDGGNLKITPGTTYGNTVHSIELREVVSKDNAALTYELSVDNVISEGDAGLTAFWNVAIGAGNSTLGSLQNGSRNVAVGINALQNMTSGERNVGVGSFALNQMKWGVRNIAIGSDSLYRLEEPVDNVAIGMGAGGATHSDPSAHSCQRNVAVGTHAMMSGVKDYYDNVSIGDRSMSGLSSATAALQRNTSVGSEACYRGLEDNVSIGYRANRYNRGSKNIHIGAYSGGLGSPVTEGSENIIIGYMAEIKNGSESSFSNTIVIGSQTKATKSSQVVIGNKSQTELIVLGNKLLKFNPDGTVTWEEIS